MFSGVLCDEQSLGRGPGREGRGGVVGGGGGCRGPPGHWQMALAKEGRIPCCTDEIQLEWRANACTARFWCNWGY